MNPRRLFGFPLLCTRVNNVATLVLPGVLAVIACSPPGPTAKPPGHVFGGDLTASDASMRNDAATDIDSSTALFWTYCANVAPASTPGEGVINNSVQNPLDFSVTRVVIGFAPDCAAPTLTLELSDGRCPDGKDHRLTIEFDADAIAHQDISLGDVDIAIAHSKGQINVRYERPANLSPSGTFGTCGGESGVITLTEIPSLSRGSVYSGSYQMTLNACAGSVGAPQDLQGTFNAELHSNLTDLCPAFTPGP